MNKKVIIASVSGLLVVIIFVVLLLTPIGSGVMSMIKGIKDNTGNAISPPTNDYGFEGGEVPVVSDEGNPNFLNEEPYDIYAQGLPISLKVTSFKLSGNATLVQNDGYNVLIDSSSSADVSKLIEQLKQLGVEKIRYFITSNYNETAVGGATSIVKAFPVDYIVLAENVTEQAEGKSFVSYLDSSKLLYTIPTGTARYVLGSTIIELIQTHTGGSLLTVLYDGNTKMVITGDITQISPEAYEQLPTNVDTYLVSARKSVYTFPEGIIDKIKPKKIYMTGTNKEAVDKVSKEVSTLSLDFYHSTNQNPLTILSNGKDVAFEDKDIKIEDTKNSEVDERDTSD